MKYDRYERDARAFGFPPAFLMSMIEHEQAHGYAPDEAYERALTRIDDLKQLSREESNAIGVADRIDVACRVFRSAKDVADAMLERRLHGRQQQE